MKKLTNDPSRNVNAVSGMWVRLRKDGSKYDVRYVNARVRRVWLTFPDFAGHGVECSGQGSPV